MSFLSTIALAEARTFSASTSLAQQFQLFQPIGGVSAMVSPMTILSFLSSEPLSLLARSLTTKSPGESTVPVIRPVFVSSFSDGGNPDALNDIGRSPVAGTVNRNGRPGRWP